MPAGTVATTPIVTTGQDCGWSALDATGAVIGSVFCPHLCDEFNSHHVWPDVLYAHWTGMGPLVGTTTVLTWDGMFFTGGETLECIDGFLTVKFVCVAGLYHLTANAFVFIESSPAIDIITPPPTPSGTAFMTLSPTGCEGAYDVIINTTP